MAGKTMSMMNITATTSEDELLEAILAMCTSISPSALMEMVAKLPEDSNTHKIGALAIGSSMNIREVINSVRAKAGIVLPENWLVNGEINFSVSALLGHIIMMLADDMLTTKGQMAKEAYVKSIGGVADISMYTEATVVEGKEKRTAILLKWANMLRKFDAKAHQALLAKKFPKLVKDKRSTSRKIGDLMSNVIVAPFRAFTWFLRTAWELFKTVIWFAYYIALIFVIYKAVTVLAIPWKADEVATIYGMTEQSFQEKVLL
jgi:hypothetical protein